VTGSPGETRGRPTSDALAEERRRLRQLKVIVDLTAGALAQDKMTRREGEDLVAAARRRILELFPEKEETYELVLAPRFARLLAGQAPPNLLPFVKRAR
jgi:hypothetical protein